MSKSFNDLNLIVFPCSDIRNMLGKLEFKSFFLVQGKKSSELSSFVSVSLKTTVTIQRASQKGG